MFSNAKDFMAGKAAKAYVNSLIARYGSVETLKIDSSHHRIEVVCQLTGEGSPIGVTIEKYVVEDQGGKKFIRIVESSATRPWLQAVIRDHAHGRSIEVPAWAASAL